MSQKRVQDSTPSGERSIVQEYFAHLERNRIKIPNNILIKNIYDLIVDFDDAYVDFFKSDLNGDIKDHVEKQMEILLGSYLAVFYFLGFDSQERYKTFRRLLGLLKLILKENKQTDNIERIRRTFRTLDPSVLDTEGGSNSYVVARHGMLFTRSGLGAIDSLSQFQHRYGRIIDDFELSEKDDELFEECHEYDEFMKYCLFPETRRGNKQDEDRIVIWADDHRVLWINYDEQDEAFVDEKKYAIILDYTFDNSHDSVSLDSLSKSMNALQLIEDVVVDLDEIGRGSLFARVIVWMKDAYTRFEVLALLEWLADAVSATVPGASKWSEVLAARLERKVKERDLLNQPSEEELKEDRVIERTRKLLELENLREDIRRKRIDSLTTVSHLMKEGIVQSDFAQIVLEGKQLVLSAKPVPPVGDDVSSPG